MGIVDSIVNFFGFKVAYCCCSLEVGCANNAFIVGVFGLIMQVALFFNQDMKQLQENPVLGIFVVLLYSLLTVMYINCFYICKIFQKEKSHIQAFCFIIPYAMVHFLYVALIRIPKDGIPIAPLIIYIYMPVAFYMIFLLYSWIVAVSLYKIIAANTPNSGVTLNGIPLHTNTTIESV